MRRRRFCCPSRWAPFTACNVAPRWSRLLPEFAVCWLRFLASDVTLAQKPAEVVSNTQLVRQEAESKEAPVPRGDCAETRVGNQTDQRRRWDEEHQTELDRRLFIVPSYRAAGFVLPTATLKRNVWVWWLTGSADWHRKPALTAALTNTEAVSHHLLSNHSWGVMPTFAR